MATLLEAVAAGKLAPVYILYSEQPLLIERAVTAIRDAAVPPNARGFNLDVIEGKAAAAERILSAARTLPMMAARRMVLVRDLAPVPAAELAKLMPYLDAPNPTTVLVAVASKIDKRIKFYAAANKKKILHELTPPKQLGPWIQAEARNLNIQIDSAVSTRLADVVGKDLARLALALEQLSLYAGDRRISVDDVDDLVADTRERSVFELTDAIGRGDRRAALASVAALCEQRQSSIGVVVMVARYMRQLRLCQVAMDKRLSKGESAKLVGVAPFIVGKLTNQARRYSPHAVAAATQKLAQADQDLKGQSDLVKVMGRQLGERVVLDRLVSDIIALAG